MASISKKQRSVLRKIDELAAERKRNRLLALVSVLLMVLVIVSYNTLVYNLGIVDEGNLAIRGMMYVTAMVIAGYSGIKLMKASRKQQEIDGYRQAAGISRETLEAWKRGEIEK